MTWIKIEDDLPESNENVLVLGHNGSMSVKYLSPNRRECWYPGGLGIGWTTHWMQLPDKPEKSEK